LKICDIFVDHLYYKKELAVNAIFTYEIRSRTNFIVKAIYCMNNNGKKVTFIERSWVCPFSRLPCVCEKVWAVCGNHHLVDESRSLGWHLLYLLAYPPPYLSLSLLSIFVLSLSLPIYLSVHVATRASIIQCSGEMNSFATSAMFPGKNDPFLAFMLYNDIVDKMSWFLRWSKMVVQW
jgi:hypothetical protein